MAPDPGPAFEVRIQAWGVQPKLEFLTSRPRPAGTQLSPFLSSLQPAYRTMYFPGKTCGKTNKQVFNKQYLENFFLD